jgi:site-specific recombinase XerD
MDHSIEELRRDLARGGYSKRTVKAYSDVATALREACDRPITDITREQLRAFVDERTKGGNTFAVVRDLQGLKFLFGRTLGKPEMVTFITLRRPRSRLPIILTMSEVHRLLGAIKEPRYQAIAMVLYGAGLRLSEAIALETRDLDGPGGVIRVRNGKGGKDRNAKLSPTLYQWLRDYWARVRPMAPYLFASRVTGKPPTRPTVRKALVLAAKGAGIDKPVYPHLLRHCFATHLLNDGVDLYIVSQLLGHALLQTTTVYTRLMRKRVREVPSPLDLLPRR